MPFLLEHLIGQLRQDALPDVVYHYASPAAFLGVVRTRSLWASDIRFLNDSQEYVYASSRVAGRLDEMMLAGEFADVHPIIDEMRGALRMAPSIPLYVASFARDGDQLSQWRAYCPAGGGYAVGFHPAILMSVADSLLLPCVYDWNRQDALCEEVLSGVVELYRRTEGEPIEDRRNRCGAEFISAFFMLAAVLKDPGFSEKQEWRLVDRGRRQGGRTVKFREGRSGVVPYVEFPLSSGNGSEAVTGVVVGPNPHPDLAIYAAQACLEESGLTSAAVERSAIPFRSW